MNSTSARLLFALTLVVSVWAGQAVADLSVSVTITGGIDEILPILQQLQDLGIGGTPTRAPDEGLKLFMHSASEGAATPAPEAEPIAPPPPPKPVTALTNAAIEPNLVQPGASVLITVNVSDPDNRIDTVAVSAPTLGALFDLYDNGTHGDKAVRDGVWSAAFTVPGNVPAGACAFDIAAYDANGDPVTVPTDAGTPSVVSTRATCTFVR